jgi:hypothetical protein
MARDVFILIIFLVTGSITLAGSGYHYLGIPLLFAVPIAVYVTDDPFLHLCSGLPATIVALEQGPIVGLVPLLVLLILVLSKLGIGMNRRFAFGFALFSAAGAVFTLLISATRGLVVSLVALGLAILAVLLYLAYARHTFTARTEEGTS